MARRPKKYVIDVEKGEEIEFVYINNRFKILEKVVAFSAVAMPFTIIPQVTDIWMNKSAAGVSVVTWLLFLLLTIPLITYSVIKGEKKLALMWSLSSAFYVAILAGIGIYG